MSVGEPSTIQRAPFTYHFNDQDHPEQEMIEWMNVFDLTDPAIKCAVFQFEIAPTTGSIHVQGFLRLKKGVSWRIKRFKKFVGANTLRAHLTLPCRGSDEENRVYCTKADSRYPGCEPVEFGVFSTTGQGHRTDLVDVAQAILDGGSYLDAARTHPGTFIRYHRGLEALENASRTVERRLAWPTDGPSPYPNADFRWYYGASGTGKTASVYGEFAHVYAKDSTNKWFDGYKSDYHDCILIDDYRVNTGLPYTSLLSILDIYPKSVERKLGTIHLANCVIIVTCNYPPWYLFNDESAPKPGVDPTPLVRRLYLREF